MDGMLGASVRRHHLPQVLHSAARRDVKKMCVGGARLGWVHDASRPANATKFAFRSDGLDQIMLGAMAWRDARRTRKTVRPGTGWVECLLLGLLDHGACSVAVSYKPPMLVTRVRLPACAIMFH